MISYSNLIIIIIIICIRIHNEIINRYNDMVNMYILLKVDQQRLGLFEYALPPIAESSHRGSIQHAMVAPETHVDLPSKTPTTFLISTSYKVRPSTFTGFTNAGASLVFPTATMHT